MGAYKKICLTVDKRHRGRTLACGAGGPRWEGEQLPTARAFGRRRDRISSTDLGPDFGADLGPDRPRVQPGEGQGEIDVGSEAPRAHRDQVRLRFLIM